MSVRSPAITNEPIDADDSDNGKITADRLVDEQYTAWTASLDPQRKAWEAVLQDRLGSTFGGYYLSIYKQDRVNGTPTAWDFVEDNPRLPHVLLIGDSISRGYTMPARTHLADKANVHRAPENCGSTLVGVERIDAWLGGRIWDVIHFNFGLHDCKKPPGDYEQRLRKIVARLQQTKARLIWATTTPRHAKTREDEQLAEADARLRIIANQIMTENGIVVNDLFAAISPFLAEMQNSCSVHFNDRGNTFLGTVVAQAIEHTLASRPDCPL